jgi:hypothetical protein
MKKTTSTSRILKNLLTKEKDTICVSRFLTTKQPAIICAIAAQNASTTAHA